MSLVVLTSFGVKINFIFLKKLSGVFQLETGAVSNIVENKMILFWFLIPYKQMNLEPKKTSKHRTWVLELGYCVKQSQCQQTDIEDNWWDIHYSIFHFIPFITLKMFECLINQNIWFILQLHTHETEFKLLITISLQLFRNIILCKYLELIK